MYGWCKSSLLRTSYPNCGYSKHIDLNSSSASARRVCDLVAQKFATGARIAMSSLCVCAYTYLAYEISPLAVEFTQWIFDVARVLRAGRLSVSASV